VFIVNSDEATDSSDTDVSKGGNFSFFGRRGRFTGLFFGLTPTAAGFCVSGGSGTFGASGFKGGGIRTTFCLGPLGPRFSGLSAGSGAWNPPVIVPNSPSKSAYSQRQRTNSAYDLDAVLRCHLGICGGIGRCGPLLWLGLGEEIAHGRQACSVLRRDLAHGIERGQRRGLLAGRGLLLLHLLLRRGIEVDEHGGKAACIGPGSSSVRKA
jgi:hypothetical protein